ncbi:hypothetical protein ACHAWO_013958 [Cyclotella atomus]|uniref:Uncharacterized protein n=1 Tax=Cyclotella atomus TaxID=382360 RepID=A0ABD3PXY2_9STRA
MSTAFLPAPTLWSAMKISSSCETALTPPRLIWFTAKKKFIVVAHLCKLCKKSVIDIIHLNFGD